MRHGPKWDACFMGVAREVATWSKDPKECVGAVLVSPDGRQVSWGYNGLPRGIVDDERMDDPEVKLQLSVHAERNARDNCAVRPEGWHLFVTKSPCAQCATTIIQSGVARVVTFLIRDESSWANSQYLARSILEEAGISVVEEGQICL